MFNDKLNINVVKKLLYNLQMCDFPFYCVHGRNSVYPLLILTSSN